MCEDDLFRDVFDSRLTFFIIPDTIPLMEHLSLKVDYAFKRFFITWPDLLIDFLNAVFEEYDHINILSVKILNPELPVEAIEDKKAILDIHALDDRGNTYNIEMQAHFRDGYLNRTAFYAFRLYLNGIGKGEEHSQIAPVYSINLVDFTLFQGLSFHRCFRLLDVKEPSVVMMDGIEFHLKLEKMVMELESPLEIWVRFIRDSAILTDTEMDALEKKYPPMKKAYSALEEISQDSEARLEYDKRQAAIFFHDAALKKKFSDGKIEGKLEDARKMLEKRYPLADVLEITGLMENDLFEAKILIPPARKP